MSCSWRFGSTQGYEILDEVGQLLAIETALQRGHWRGQEAEFTQVALVEGTQALAGVEQLHAEDVLVQQAPAYFLAIGGNHAIETLVGLHDGIGVEQRGSQFAGAAQRADAAQVGAQSRTLAGNA